MKIKKILAIILVVCLIFSLGIALAACGDDDNTGGGDGGGNGGGNIYTPSETAYDPNLQPKMDDWGIFTYKGQSIYAYSGSDKVVKLPSQVNGQDVTNIYFDGSNPAYQPFLNSSIEVLHIPATMTIFPEYDNPLYGAKKLRKIFVDEANPAFASVDGVLYNKDKTELICCPYNKTDALVLPDTVKKVTKKAIECYSLVGSDGPEGENALNSDFTNFGYFSTKISSVKLSSAIEEFTFEGCRDLRSVDFGQ